MIVLKSTHDKLLEENYELQRKIAELNSKIYKATITPCEKIEEGSLVLNEDQVLRKITVVNGNWVPNIHIDELRVSVPTRFSDRFKNGPVSKEDLIDYMSNNGHFNVNP